MHAHVRCVKVAVPRRICRGFRGWRCKRSSPRSLWLTPATLSWPRTRNLVRCLLFHWGEREHQHIGVNRVDNVPRFGPRIAEWNLSSLQNGNCRETQTLHQCFQRAIRKAMLFDDIAITLKNIVVFDLIYDMTNMKMHRVTLIRHCFTCSFNNKPFLYFKNHTLVKRPKWYRFNNTSYSYLNLIPDKVSPLWHQLHIFTIAILTWIRLIVRL